MKSLFSENDIVLPEWLGILLEKVDRDTVQELLAEHEEYQTFRAKRKELLNRYPVIETLLEDSGGGVYQSRNIMKYWSIFKSEIK